MRHNLGSDSAPWAREVESRLAALEAPSPETKTFSATPKNQIWFRVLTVDLDYTGSGNRGVSGVLTLAKPLWAQRISPLTFDIANWRLSGGFYYKNTYQLWLSTPERPNWVLSGSTYGALNPFDLGSSGQLRVQIRDSMALTPPAVVANQVSLLLAWLP